MRQAPELQEAGAGNINDPETVLDAIITGVEQCWGPVNRERVLCFANTDRALRAAKLGQLFPGLRDNVEPMREFLCNCLQSPITRAIEVSLQVHRIAARLARSRLNIVHWKKSEYTYVVRLIVRCVPASCVGHSCLITCSPFVQVHVGQSSCCSGPAAGTGHKIERQRHRLV